MSHPVETIRDAERGMATAEFAVGTLGACAIALVLRELATDGFWLDLITEAIGKALRWGDVLPRFPLAPNRWLS